MNKSSRKLELLDNLGKESPMKRSEIKEEDKWDLTKYFKNEKEYDELYDRTLNILKKIVKMKGHLTDDDKSLLKFLELDDELDLNVERLYVYSYLNHYEDTNAEKGKRESWREA